MKKRLLATAVALASTSAFAEPTAVMKVTGTMTNPACTAELGNGGVVDFGTISLGELSATSNNHIGEKTLPVTISCVAPTKVGFSIVDNRRETNAGISVPLDSSSSANKIATFGVGTTEAGVNIGSYAFMAQNAVADSTTVSIINHNNDWTDTKWNTSTIPRNDGFNILSFANTGTLTPIAIKTVTFGMMTSLSIQSTGTLAITDDTALDGQATMTLVYL
ncbi:DUF1120 domain-containing protein [Enterobacter cloacae]|uniref:DUF1120 domain-containing protein n=1 Tax=Enterobacter cloacae TaxID=550 RepID=UPI0021826898|nr:DUF1120 domain-containing protein [Enterobacter cloacae]MCT2766202.1 DUF1120 domain-containing protein [Enterobacter cloacae]